MKESKWFVLSNRDGMHGFYKDVNGFRIEVIRNEITKWSVYCNDYTLFSRTIKLADRVTFNAAMTSAKSLEQFITEHNVHYNAANKVT